MARLRHGNQEVLNYMGGNRLMAHLQTAAFERFQEGKGFFISFFGGTDNDGEPTPTNSLWCPPEVPLHFTYDDYDEPVQIDPKLVETLLKAMNDPLGVIVSGVDQPIWPFTLVTTDRAVRSDESE